MKKIHILVLYFQFWIQISSACLENQYNSGDNCEKCSRYCLYCESSTQCHLCASEFFLFNGYCYRNCKHPLYPLIIQNNAIKCEEVKSKIISTDQFMIDEYNSNQGVETIIVRDFYNKLGLELSLWIRFRDLGLESDKSNILVLSNNFMPHQNIHTMPYIVKLGLEAGVLTGPNDIVDIKQTVKENAWYLIAMKFEFKTQMEHYVHIGIIIYDFSDNIEPVKAKSKVFLSSLFIESNIVLHVGNLQQAQRLQFDAHKVRVAPKTSFIYRGYPLLFADQFKSHNFVQKKSESIIEQLLHDGYISFYFKIDEEFQVYLLDIMVNILTTVFPSSFIQIYQDGSLVYDVEFLLIEDLIAMKRGKVLESMLSNIFQLKIVITKLEEKIIFFDGNKFFVLPNSPDFEIKIASSFNSTKLNSFKMMISKNPFFTEIFEGIEARSYSYKCSLQKNIETHQACLLFIPKLCPGDPNLTFYYSLENCNLKFRHICLNNIPHCDICLNSTYCFKCSYEYPNYNGFCLPSAVNPKLICLNDSKSLFSHCEDCSLLKNVVMINNNCEDCNEGFQNCQENLNINFCVETYLALGCVLSSPGACSRISGCSICQIKNMQFICLGCKEGFLHNNTCIDCPNGLYKYLGSCHAECPKDRAIIKDGFCQNCNIIGGPLARADCSYICPSDSLYFNETCVSIYKIDRCLVMGKDWCYFCPRDSMISDCKNRKDIPKLISALEDLPTDSNFFDRYYAYDCPKNSSELLQFEYYCQRNRGGSDSKNHNDVFEEEIYSYQIVKRECLEYLEGFYIIWINETCLYVPMTHFFTLTQFDDKILNSPIKITESIKINEIKLTNDSNMNGKISSGVLYLEYCPIRFYRTSDDFCKFCGHDCLFCFEARNKEVTCTVDINVTDNNFQVKYVERIFQIFHVSSHDSSLLTVQKPRKNTGKCPKTCNSCYFTGKEYFCTECIDENFEFDLSSFICTCKDDKYFDQNSLTCVSSCPEGTKVKEHECVNNCLSPTIRSDIMIFQLSNADEICYNFCPRNMMESSEFEFDKEIRCLKNYFHEKFSYFTKQSSVSMIENVTKSLWNHGLIQLKTVANLRNFDVFLVYFRNISSQDTTTRNRIVDTLSYLQFQKTAKHLIPSIYNLVEEIVAKSTNLSTIMKALYFFQISLPNLFDEIKMNLFKQNILQIDQENLDMALSFKVLFHLKALSLNSSIRFVNVEKDQTIYISFKLNSPNAPLNKKHKLSISGSINLNIYFGNYYSKYLKKTNFHETLEIFKDCIYFIVITKIEINENFNAMIDRDLFEGSDSYATDLDSIIFVAKDSNIKTILIIFLSILGACLFIVAFVYFLKTKILNPSRFKFIQMRNLDSDDEIDEDEEEKE